MGGAKSVGVHMRDEFVGVAFERIEVLYWISNYGANFLEFGTKEFH